MMMRRLGLAALCGAVTLNIAGPALADVQHPAAIAGNTFKVKPRFAGLQSPIWVGHAPGDRRGIWVAQQSGELIRLAGRRKRVMLSIAHRTKAKGETGLLGVAFLPGYASNHLVALHSTNRRGDTRVELWRLGNRRGNARLVRTLLRVRQPSSSHKGGQLTFGTGNRLYLGLGDGGGDHPSAPQDLSSRLGKILVTTVNPKRRSHWSVAAYGLRNPWRFWVDPLNREMWIGDVGEDRAEEIDRVPLDGSAPANLGWASIEGSQPVGTAPSALRGPGPVLGPVVTYPHDAAGACSVIGGEIYRGARIPALRGRYVFGDFCTGCLWSLQPTPNGVESLRIERAKVGRLTSFGTDSRGELLATSITGVVYGLVPA